MLAIAALFGAVSARYATFAATIVDGSGYVSEASRWLARDLFGPMPFVFLPAWPDVSLVFPLGYRLGPVTGTDVPSYPPGFPLVMAAAMSIGGELAAYLVPPLLGAGLVWATGELATTLAGPRAAVIAAALMATSPIALSMAMSTMSDVPAAAWWILSLTLALRGRAFAAVAAGLAAAMAILTRPNLAPLAAIPVFLAFSASGSNRLLQGGLCGAGVSLGLGILMWTQALLYGSPTSSGHPGIENLFRLSYVPDNLFRYARWYAETHTPLVLLASLAPLVFWRPVPAARGGSRRLALTLLVFAVGVYVAYLPYFPYTDWLFLRFMLPAMAPLFALTAAVLARGIDRLPRLGQVPALALLLALITGNQVAHALDKQVTEHALWNQRVRMAGQYLENMLPSNAVVVTFFHSGSIRYYTGHAVLRPDLVPPDRLDAALEQLEQNGYKPYVLVDRDLERAGLLARFPSSRLGRLDWPARAQIGTHGHIALYDLADRARHARGEQWPVDTLR
jgi:Dolichyl-phosphate-mannose-protein mannosyltransferase